MFGVLNAQGLAFNGGCDERLSVVVGGDGYSLGIGVNDVPCAPTIDLNARKGAECALLSYDVAVARHACAAGYQNESEKGRFPEQVHILSLRGVGCSA